MLLYISVSYFTSSFRTASRLIHQNMQKKAFLYSSYPENFSIAFSNQSGSPKSLKIIRKKESESIQYFLNVTRIRNLGGRSKLDFSKDY